MNDPRDQVLRTQMREAERKRREQADVLEQLAALVKELAVQVQALDPGHEPGLQGFDVRATELEGKARHLAS